MSRPWGQLLAASVLLGLVALLVNVTSVDQMSGQADGLAALRKTVSKVVNAGTVWAGLMVLAGALVRRPGVAAAAGPVSGVVALAVHYGVGGVLDLMPWAGLGDNAWWFVAAVVLGVPLGVVGALSRRPTRIGLGAALVVPLGAVVEPFLVGWLPPAPTTWPNQVSGVVAGSLLVLAGMLGAAWVWFRSASGRTSPAASASA